MKSENYSLMNLEKLNIQEEMNYSCDTMLDIYPTANMDYSVLTDREKSILDKVITKIIATIRCKTIIYISCKPTSLVRDLEVFLAGGYVVEKACAVDQFPWTANVETICRLVLKDDQQKDQ